MLKEVIYVLVMLHCISSGTFSRGRKWPWPTPAWQAEHGGLVKAEQFEVAL